MDSSVSLREPALRGIIFVVIGLRPEPGVNSQAPDPLLIFGNNDVHVFPILLEKQLDTKSQNKDTSENLSAPS